jgi:hypothetical protein
MSQDILRNEIIVRSESKQWHEARQEWRLRNIWMSDEPDTCLCTYPRIYEICVIENVRTGEVVEVGNSCVRHFLSPTDRRAANSAWRVVKDADAKPNGDLIDFAYARGMISPWEHEFARNTWRKRKLSDLQRLKRKEISEKIRRELLAPRAAQAA